jgi:hypothetical protein
VVQRAFHSFQRKGNKARKKKAWMALVRSKALLYRYLTKEQKWSLRAEKSFWVKGKDGHKYEVRASGCNNVTRYEEGEPVYRFCVVAKYDFPIPVYDLLLGQKLMLETDTRTFLDTAVTHHLPTGERWHSGKHIDNPDVEPPLSFKQRQAQLRDGGYDTWEREQAEEIERRRNETCGLVGDLLLHDICVNEEARYDGQLNGIGFVLNADLEVVPTYDVPFSVPPLENANADECIIKLITGLPAETYPSVAHVQAHFITHDLFGINVLMHPETDTAWVDREMPPWTRGNTVLGVKKILDERVPKGKAWYVADGETVGLVTHWYEEAKKGFCVFNLDGVAVYEPPHAQDQVQAQEASLQAIEEESRREIQAALLIQEREGQEAQRFIEALGQQSEEADEATRLHQGQGH